MIEIKESFKILAKAMEMEGIQFDPEVLRSLKYSQKTNLKAGKALLSTLTEFFSLKGQGRVKWIGEGQHELRENIYDGLSLVFAQFDLIQSFEQKIHEEEEVPLDPSPEKRLFKDRELNTKHLLKRIKDEETRN